MGLAPMTTALCLMGPTATGKTDLALALADRLPIGLISVDSAMVYRHLNIGSGKPPPEVLARHPHRLIDVREPWEQYTAGDFARDASQAIDEIRRGGRIPLLVGGTFLYFRSLIQGLTDLPTANSDLRALLEARGLRDGWSALHEELALLDPVAAARIGVRDRQRIQRALEVCLLTGQPLSVLQSRHQESGGLPVPGGFFRIGLLPRDRGLLSERITRRFHAMLERGFLGEVEQLLSMPQMQPDSPALRAVGYRQLAQFLAGACSRAEAEDRALAATRQLAKRQLTWLRREECDVWLDMTSDTLLEDLEAVVRGAALRMQYQP